MHGVPERVEDRGDLPVHRRIVPPDVGHGKTDVFRKSTRPVNPDSLRVGAEMPAPRQAVSTASTHDVSFSAHYFSRMKIADIRTGGNNLPDKFVPDHHGHRNRLLCPLIPLVDVEVGSTDPGMCYPDE